MSFDTEGHFSGELDLYQIAILPQYKEYFDFIFRLNLLAQEHKFKYSCNNLDRIKIISNCLFLKILNVFQSCIILLKHLLPFEASALSRTLCEPLYLIKILLDDESEFWREYLKQSAYLTKKTINVAKQNPHEIFDLVRDYATIEVIEDLDKKLQSFNPNQFKVENLAIKAGLKNHYDTMFRVTSNEVHTPPYVIFRYVEFNENNEAIAFNFGPATKEYDRIIIAISDVLIKSLVFMDNLHKIEHHKDFDAIVIRWKTLNQQTE